MRMFLNVHIPTEELAGNGTAGKQYAVYGAQVGSLRPASGPFTARKRVSYDPQVSHLRKYTNNTGNR